GIDAMVTTLSLLGLSVRETNKAAESILALSQTVGLGIVLGAAIALARRWPRAQSLTSGQLGAALGLVAALPALGLGFLAGSPDTISPLPLIWVPAVFGGWGATIGWSRGRVEAPPKPAPYMTSRRIFLARLAGGAAALTAAGTGIGYLLGQRTSGRPSADVAMPAEMPTATGSPTEEELEARIEPAPGTRPELTSNQEFYRIDINLRPPVVDAASWRLQLGGLVERPLTLTLDEIMARPAMTQIITLSCISNRIAGDLISTSAWTGVRLKDILDEAGLMSEAQELFIEAADGFYESVSHEDMLDDRTMLVYAMNGEPLPEEHGFPLRIYIPNRYGMKQPKWIVSMEAIGEDGRGYWVDRGWSAEAIPQTTSVIDTVSSELAETPGDVAPIGGIAYAGARGISRVEVQIDDGPWVEAQLRAPPLSRLTWVQWRYDWPYDPGRHIFRVRAYDGAGRLQPVERRGVRPDGATGVHEVRRTL
ncbi:MAG: molybdopterin-dependent oxidoreductase, partial [Anaerolineae bacterium]